MIALLLAGCVSDEISTAVLRPPPLRDPARVRLVAFGDSGKGNDDQARVADGIRAVCAREGCDLLLMLGDNLYPRGLDGEDDPRADAIIAEPYRGIAPLYPVLGNHDWGGASPAAAEAQIAWAAGQPDVHLPAHAWSMRAGPVLFAGLDTHAVFLRGEAFTRDWLLDVFAEDDALGPGRAAYRVVLGHHPYRSDGPHGNAGRYEDWSSVPWLSGAAIARLFEAAVCGRADLYLAGHDHSLQLLEACGVDLVVSGAAAATTELYDRGNAPRFEASALGFTWLELGAGGGRLRFHDADGGVLAELPLAAHGPRGGG